MQTLKSKTDDTVGKSAVGKGKMSLKVPLAYLFCALIWGTTWFAIRISIAAGGYPTFLAAALRFSVAVILFIGCWCAYRQSLRGPGAGEFRWLTLAGMLCGVQYGLLYFSEQTLSGGIAAVISATSPLLTALMAYAARIETSSRMTVIGSLVSLVGIAVVFHDRLLMSTAQASAIGVLVVVSLFNGASNVLIKRHAQNLSPVVSNSVFFASVTGVLWLMSLAKGPVAAPVPLPFAATAAMLYLGVFGTFIAFGAYFYLLKHVRLSTAMTLAFVTPVIALTVDSLFEKHIVLTMETYAGVAIVLLGVAMNVLMQIRGEKERVQ